VDPQIVSALRCPVCAGRLGSAAGSLRCPAGHAFDLARQGYVDLSGGRLTHPGDTADMIAARQRVLDAGHFDFLSAALAEAAAGAPEGLAVDVGAGTGHHLAAVLDARPAGRGLAVDVSKAALRRAARAHPRIGAVRADVWHGLPLADGAVAVVLDVFAPRAGREFARILAPEGRLIVVTPTPDHLTQLGLAVGVDPAKEERLAAALEPWFERVEERELRASLELTADDACAIAAMGPSAHHAGTADPRAGVVTAALRLTVWRHRAG
jgi:23S rRNA (guanine745-N1)-methyltransferase